MAIRMIEFGKSPVSGEPVFPESRAAEPKKNKLEDQPTPEQVLGVNNLQSEIVSVIEHNPDIPPRDKQTIQRQLESTEAQGKLGKLWNWAKAEAPGFVAGGAVGGGLNFIAKNTARLGLGSFWYYCACRRWCWFSCRGRAGGNK